GQLTIYANVAGGQATVSLNGTGTAAAAIVLTPLTLSFAATIVNQTAASQNITVSNTGGTLATLSAPVLSGEAGDFAVFANTCGATLAADTGCTLSVTFTPTASGARSATLSITDNAGTSSAATQTASHSGIGEAPATDTLSTAALNFTVQQIGTTSAAQTITLTNSGGVPLTLIAASVSPGDFSVVNACGNSLAAHATCAFNVTFSPTAVGARTATLTITDQFHYQTVLLTGTGIAGPGVSLTPVSLVYPATGVGLTALAQTLTLTNNGGVPLTVSKVAVSPGFAIALNSCTTTLAVDAACPLTIVFAPTAPGPITGTLTFTDNASSGVQTTSLSGTGIAFSLTATGATSATVAGGGASVTYALQLSSPSGLSGNVALSCSGAPANSTCTVTPGIGALGTTAPIIVTVETAVPSVAAVAAPSRPFRASAGAKAVLLALLLPIAFFQRRRNPWIAHFLVMLCALGVLSGCGASRTIPVTGTTGGGGGTPTAPGTSTLTISASAAGLTRSVSLTVIVQ
ncbi:MAG TPA: choice-of-anchor D domain-containing protein, partial [Mycobacterium sp.]